jgi:hypothetical protein
MKHGSCVLLGSFSWIAPSSSKRVRERATTLALRERSGQARSAARERLVEERDHVARHFVAIGLVE